MGPMNPAFEYIGLANNIKASGAKQWKHWRLSNMANILQATFSN